MNGNGGAEKSSIRILLADGDQEERNTLKVALSNQPRFEVLAAVGDGERAARLAAQLLPDIAVLEMGMMRSDGSDAAESIALTTPSCQLILLADRSDAETIRRAMQAGAREFLMKPVDDLQLVQAIMRVYEFAVKQQSIAAVDDTARPQERAQTGKVFAVWAPKGGVGKTVVAVNLAVAIASIEHRRTLLMDGCLGFCTADVALDIDAKQNILDLLVDYETDLDPELISRVVVRHATGLDVLLAPSLEELVQVAPAHLQRILTVMRRLYEYIIIDTRSVLDETTIAFLDLSDVILTVCNPEIASLRNLRTFLDAASRLGYGVDKVRLILNRYDMRGAIPQAEIEKVCRYHVMFSIPNDTEAVAGSINHGQPLAVYQPNRLVTKEIARLASLLIEKTGKSDGRSPAGRAQIAALGRILSRKKP